ncbi:MAG: hypothetical protein ACOY3V_03500 [Pseudomonadota bacterium]
MKRAKQRAPRNPLIVPTLFRKSGAHQKTNKAKRRKEKVAVQQQLSQSNGQ